MAPGDMSSWPELRNPPTPTRIGELPSPSPSSSLGHDRDTPTRIGAVCLLFSHVILFENFEAKNSQTGDKSDQHKQP